MICVLFAALLLLSGCQIGGRDIVVSGIAGSKDVFRIGGASCSLKETKVYLANNRNIYGTACGVNLWEHDFETIPRQST